MRIATILDDAGHGQAAFVVGDRVVTASRAMSGNARTRSGQATISMRGLLDLGGAPVAAKANTASMLAAGDGGEGDDWRAGSEIRRGVPVPDPEKIICVGMNFRDHAAEANMEIPTVAPLCGIFRNALIAHGGPVVMPAVSGQVDWEGEVAVVIGDEAKDVA